MESLIERFLGWDCFKLGVLRSFRVFVGRMWVKLKVFIGFV